IKLTPSSIARRRTAIAAAGSLGGPQIPSPVIRMAPKPRRLTVSSPPSETFPPLAADRLVVFPFIFTLQKYLCTFARSDYFVNFTPRCASSNPDPALTFLQLP